MNCFICVLIEANAPCCLLHTMGETFLFEDIIYHFQVFYSEFFVIFTEDWKENLENKSLCRDIYNKNIFQKAQQNEGMKCDNRK